MKIKTGDKVVVISGKDRGKTGKVERAFPEEGSVIVEGANVHKKHQRARQQGQQGQVVEVSAPMPASNVKLICSSCGEATRIGVNTEGETKERICKKCGKTV